MGSHLRQFSSLFIRADDRPWEEVILLYHIGAGQWAVLDHVEGVCIKDILKHRCRPSRPDSDRVLSLGARPARGELENWAAFARELVQSSGAPARQALMPLADAAGPRPLMLAAPSSNPRPLMITASSSRSLADNGTSEPRHERASRSLLDNSAIEPRHERAPRSHTDNGNLEPRRERERAPRGLADAPRGLADSGTAEPRRERRSRSLADNVTSEPRHERTKAPAGPMLEQPKKPVGGGQGVFTTKHRAEFAAKGLKASAIAKLASKRWAKLTAKEQEPYVREFKILKQKYIRDMKAFLENGGVKLGVRDLALQKRKAKEGVESRKRRRMALQKDTEKDEAERGAFGCFLGKHVKDLQKECPGDPAELKKMARAKWKAMSGSQKKTYEEMYEKTLTSASAAHDGYQKSSAFQEGYQKALAAHTRR